MRSELRGEGAKSSYRAPLVSVVVPCYNAAPFLRQTVQSVSEQTYAPIELVLVDDGSTDATRELIACLGQEVRSKLFSVSEQYGANQGASMARNRGLALANGEFIQFLDADDMLRPRAIELRVNALIASGADVAYSDWRRWREDRSGRFRAAETVTRTIEEIHTDSEIATFTSFWAPPAALLYRREMVDRIGPWHPGLPVIQDARFLQDAAHHGARFVHVPEVLADYREHRSSSLSRRSAFAFDRDVLTNTEEIEQRWRCTRDRLTRDQILALTGAYHHCAVNLFWLDQELFERACVRLEELGASSDPMVRVWRSCQRWGYASVRATHAPARAARKALEFAKRPLREPIHWWRERGVRAELLP